MSRRFGLGAALPLIVLAALAALLVPSSAMAANPIPTGGFLDVRDPMFENPSYLSLSVKGRPDSVTVKSHGASAFGRLDPNSSNTIRPGHTWDFGNRRVDRTPAMKRMLRNVFREYDRRGLADVRVQTVAEDGTRLKFRCTLTERTADSSCTPA